MGGGDRSLRSAVVWALVLGLVMGPAVSAPAASVSAKVTVNSEPAGAEVLADGVAQGATPIDIALTPGEHRISVVKDGYLDNSRTVTLAASESRSLHVALTATGRSSRPRAATAFQVEPGEPASEGGGGGKKWLWIGLGAAALTGGGLGLYLATKNSAPEAGSITVSPASGMAGATSFSFSSNAKDDKTSESALQYAWSFGDGASGSGRTVSHTYASAGTFTVSLTVTDEKDKSSTASPASVTVVRSMAGTWTGRVPGVGNPTTIRLNQSGSTLSGTLSWGPPADNSQTIWCNGTCTGTVSGTSSTAYPATVSFTGTISGVTYRFSGSSADGNTMVGASTWSWPGVVSGGGTSTFTRQ